MPRWLRRTLVAIVVLGGVIAIALIVTLSSTGVARRVIALGLSRSSADLSVTDVAGPLRGPLVLTGVRYRADGYVARIDSIVVDWRPAELLVGRVHVSRLHVAGVRIVMRDSAPPDTAGPGPRPDPPVTIVLDDVALRNVRVDGPADVALRLDSVAVRGRARDYRFAVHGTATARRVGEMTIAAQGGGDLVEASVQSGTIGVLDGTAAVAGRVKWWPRVGWDLTIAASELRPGLTLDDPATLPGALAGWGATRGVSDSAGPRGLILIDSVQGVVRGQPTSGHGEIAFHRTTFDVNRLLLQWGSATVQASGRAGDTLDLAYEARIRDLASLRPKARGSLRVNGSVTGPRLAPRVTAGASGRDVGYGEYHVSRLGADVDARVAEPRAPLEIVVEGVGGSLGRQLIERVRLSARGTTASHRVTGILAATADTVLLAATGGLEDRRWAGLVEQLAVLTSDLGGWHLEQPSRLAVGPRSATLERSCLAADSAGGTVCADAQRRGPAWNANVVIDAVPLTRLPIEALNTVAGGRAAFSGTLSAEARGRSNGREIDATARVFSTDVTFRYREGPDSVEREIVLDSAVVDIHGGRDGLIATLGVRVLTDGGEAAILGGRAVLPDYRVGDELGRQPLEARLGGQVPDVGFMEPLFIRLDSLEGAVALRVDAAGTVRAPRIAGELQVDQFRMALLGQRALAATLDVRGHLALAPDRSIEGEIRAVPSELAYRYEHFGAVRRLTVDSGQAVFQAGADGLRLDAGVRLMREGSRAVSRIVADAALPGYTRLGGALAGEPVRADVRADVRDLAVLEPFAGGIDSLSGQLDLQLDVAGRLGTPEIEGRLTLDNGRAVTPLGTSVQGGLDGDVSVVVAPDSTLAGTMSLVPRDVWFAVAGTDSLDRVRVTSGELRATAGDQGVRAHLTLQLADERGRGMATAEARVALPEYRRLGSNLSAQPVTASLDARAPDLGFVDALATQLGETSGSLTADARMSGTLGEPTIAGQLLLENGRALVRPLGIRLDTVTASLTGASADTVDIDIRMATGGGTLAVQGRSPIVPTAENPGRLRIRGSEFVALDNEFGRALVSPDLAVRLVGDSIHVQGEVVVPEAGITVSDFPERAIRPSGDIVFADTAEVPVSVRPVTAEIRVTLGDSVTFAGFDFDAELDGSILVRQAPGQLAAAIGTLVIERGHYSGYGQDLRIEDGVVRYAGGPVNDPTLDIQASRTAEDSTVAGVNIEGTLQAPVVTLFSNTPMAQNQILSYIVTGRPLGEVGGGESGSLLNRALRRLGLRGGDALAGALGETIGLDEARIETEGDLRDAAFVAGRYLSPDLYVSYGIGLFDPVSTLRLRYLVSNQLTLHAETGEETSADLLFKVDRRRRDRSPSADR